MILQLFVLDICEEAAEKRILDETVQHLPDAAEGMGDTIQSGRCPKARKCMKM